MTTEQTIIEKLTAHVISECKKVDCEELFREMLDECYSFKSVGGIFAQMSPSRVLEECDPTAFRCGTNDYVDSLGLLEIDGDNYQPDDVDEAVKSFTAELEEKISDLESEIEQDEADEDANVSELAAKQRQLAELQAELKEVEAHSF